MLEAIDTSRAVLGPMDRGGVQVHHHFAELPEFVQGAVLGCLREAGVRFSDLAAPLLVRIIADCAGFQRSPEWRQSRTPAIDYTPPPERWCGEAFWQARQGAGAGEGFRDHYWTYDSLLTDRARKLPPLTLQRNARGVLHFREG